MANFGLRVGVEGEKQFKQALRDMQAQLKTVGAEAKMVASQYDANDKSAEAMAARTDVLNKQIEAQQEKLEMLKTALENAKQTYGENSREAQAWQQKIYETQTAINNLNRQLEQNAQDTAGATDAEREGKDATEKYGKATKDAGDEAKESSKALEVLGNVAKAAGAAMATAAAAIGSAVAAAGKALAEMTTGGAEYADKVNTMSKQTGIATDTLQEYMYAAELVDVSVETLSGSMTKMIRSMSSARDGTKQYTEAYEALGVSATNADGSLRDSQTVYWELIDALGKVENETERDALAMTVFGKSAKELNPLIEAGADQMAEYARQAREAGYVLSQETLDAYNDFDDSLKRLESGSTAAKNALGTILLPVLDSLATEGVDLLGEFSTGILEADGDISKMADVLSEVLPKALDAVTQYLPEVVRIAGTIVSSLAGALLDNAPAILSAAEEVLGKLADFIIENLPGAITLCVNLIQSLVSGIVTKLPAILSAFEVVLPELLSGLQEIAKSLGTAIVDNLPAILAAINRVTKAAIKSLSDNLPGFISTVLDVITGVISAVLEATPELISMVGDVIKMLVPAILDCLPLIIDAVISIVESIGEQLPTIIDSLVTEIPSVIEQVIRAILDCLPAILKGLISLVKSLVQNLPTIIKSLSEAIPDLIGNVLDAVISCLPDIIQCIVILVGEIIKELPSILVMIIQQIPSLIGDIISGFLDCVGQFIGVGGEFLKGVWDGIVGAGAWLWEKISGFFSGIIDGIVSLFRGDKIQSLGKGIAEDLNEGYNGWEPPKVELGDDLYTRARPTGTVEGTILPASKQYAVEKEFQNSGYAAARMDTAVEMLETIMGTPIIVAIGDDQIGVANTNYSTKRGATVTEGAFANAS